MTGPIVLLVGMDVLAQTARPWRYPVAGFGHIGPVGLGHSRAVSGKGLDGVDHECAKGRC